MGTAPNLSGGATPRYLKQAGPPAREVTDEIRRRVESMLGDIEDGGLDAVRRWSNDFDNWNPDSFVVGDEEFERAAAELAPSLREHIAFSQKQVRGFAKAQRATLTDLEVEMLPGVVLGHHHIPVGSWRLRPGWALPDAGVVVHDVVVAKAAGVENVVACAPPQRGRGIHPAMLYAMETSGADLICLGGVQALAAMAFGLIQVSRRSTCSSAPATPTWPRPSASCSGGSVSICSRARPRCW